MPYFTGKPYFTLAAKYARISEEKERDMLANQPPAGEPRGAREGVPP